MSILTNPWINFATSTARRLCLPLMLLSLLVGCSISGLDGDDDDGDDDDNEHYQTSAYLTITPTPTTPDPTAVDGDDHGNTLEYATPIPRDGRISGRIESVGDVDWFALGVVRGGELEVYLTPRSLDASVGVYNAAGVKLQNHETYDDDYYENHKEYEVYVRAATYYVRVQAQAVGDYNLWVGFDD